MVQKNHNSINVFISIAHMVELVKMEMLVYDSLVTGSNPDLEELS